MPQHRGVKDLYRLCLEAIAKNLSYWTSHYEEHVLRRRPEERQRILFILGPFDELSSLMANDLLQTLSALKKTNYPSLHLIINSGRVTRLILEGSIKVVNDSIVLSIAKNCSQIKHLNLRNCKRITSSALRILSTQLSNALYLNLSGTAIDECGLCNITQNSTKLLELVLKDCKLSDQTLLGIERTAIHGRPMKLWSLDISDTRGVTVRGIRLVLKMFPHLRELHHHLLCDTIVSSSLTAHQEHQPDIAYSMTYISCLEVDNFCDDYITLLIDICPCLIRLELRLTVDLTALGLRKLSALNSLRALVLDGNDHEGRFASYLAKVKPVLESCGNRLQTLTLENLRDLDFVEVLKLFPKVKSLTLLQHGEPANFKESLLPSSLECCALSDLCIWCRIGDFSLTEENLAFVLLSAVKIRQIQLFQVENFTGTVLQQLVSESTLSMLTSLDLQECNRIEGQELSGLVTREDNMLQDIRLITNWLINRSEFERWKRLTKTMNLNVKLEWR